MEFEAAVAAPLHIVTQHTFAPGTPAGAVAYLTTPVTSGKKPNHI